MPSPLSSSAVNQGTCPLTFVVCAALLSFAQVHITPLCEVEVPRAAFMVHPGEGIV